MLELKNIRKDYPAGSDTIHALKGISLSFRESEFVSILGPSGCGKTTTLNIIGGLDGYTDGDLVINGKSTKDFKDRDWDAYRNHSIGFVLQSYNLIPHQTVLQNVELALSLSGVSKSERRTRAKKALEDVGLGTQLNKKPSEMSGGQMQRVAVPAESRIGGGECADIQYSIARREAKQTRFCRGGELCVGNDALDLVRFAEIDDGVAVRPRAHGDGFAVKCRGGKDGGGLFGEARRRRPAREQQFFAPRQRCRRVGRERHGKGLCRADGCGKTQKSA